MNGAPRVSDKLTALRERTDRGQSVYLTARCFLRGCYNFGASLEWDICLFPLYFCSSKPPLASFLVCFFFSPLNILLTDHPAHFLPDTISTPAIAFTTSASRPLSFRICTLSLRADPPVIQKHPLHGAHFFRRKMSLSWLLSLPSKLITLGPGLPLCVCELYRGN